MAARVNNCVLLVSWAYLHHEFPKQLLLRTKHRIPPVFDNKLASCWEDAPQKKKVFTLHNSWTPLMRVIKFKIDRLWQSVLKRNLEDSKSEILSCLMEFPLPLDKMYRHGKPGHYAAYTLVLFLISIITCNQEWAIPESSHKDTSEHNSQPTHAFPGKWYPYLRK